MAWCQQAASHCMSQCWLRCMLPYGITRPQWVKYLNNYQCNLYQIEMPYFKITHPVLSSPHPILSELCDMAALNNSVALTSSFMGVWINAACLGSIPVLIRARWSQDKTGSNTIFLTLSVQGQSYLGLTRSISWLLMPWLLTSPGHQQPWYWLHRIGRFLSYLRQDFNYLRRINVEKWHKM